MESPSPRSPGGSVLDRVLLFERKERESQLASSPLRHLTKSTGNEQQPPFSPRKVLAAVPKDSVEFTVQYRGPTPASPVNNLLNDSSNSGLNSDLTTYERRTGNPNYERSASGSRQDLTINSKPGITFGRSPRSDHILSPKPAVSFGISPRSDLTSPKATVVKIDKSPRSKQTLSPKIFSFSETQKPEQSPRLKSISDGSSLAPKTLPLDSDTSMNLKDSHSNNFKLVSSVQSPMGDTTMHNLKLVSPRKSREEEQRASFNPAISWKSPDHLSHFKPFPVTSRFVVLPTKNDQPPADTVSPEVSSVTPRAMTPRNFEPPLPHDPNSPTVRQRRRQFENLSVSVNHNTELVPLSVPEEAVIEEVAWPSEELLPTKVASTRRKASRGNEDLALATEEGTVEEMPWPSEVLEEFPELSWISSEDDCIEGGHGSGEGIPTEKHVALKQRPTDSDFANVTDRLRVHERQRNTFPTEKDISLEQRPVENNLTNRTDRMRGHEVQCNTLPNDGKFFDEVLCISEDPNLTYASTSISTDHDASMTSATASDYISQHKSHSSMPHQANTTQLSPEKYIRHRNHSSHVQSRHMAFTAEESVSDLHVSKSGFVADVFDAQRAKAQGHYLISGSKNTVPLSIRSKPTKETFQERDEEAQQRSESPPSRGTRYTSLSRAMHEDSLGADIDDSITVISAITAKSNMTISTEGSTGFTSRYCQLEEGLRQDVNSPSRTARMKRASRLRSLNSPISTNVLLEKSIESSSQGRDNRLPEISDLDGPPKITIEPGKLTAGLRPRSASPTFAASIQYSTTKLPDNGTSNENINTWKEMAEIDTSNVTTDSVAKSGENHLSSNMDIFCEAVRQRDNEPSEEQKTVKSTFDADVHGKERSSNQEVFKIPRSVSLRPELANAFRGKSFARTPTRLLSGANSNEDDIHSVATDSTPITRPGRTFTALENAEEIVQPQMATIHFKNDEVPLMASSQQQQTKDSSLNSKELSPSSTDELIKHSGRNTTLTPNNYDDHDRQNSNSPIRISPEAVSVLNAPSLPPLLLPQSPDTSILKKLDRRSQQMNAETIETPNESLFQPVDYTTPHTEEITSNVGRNLTENYDDQQNSYIREKDHHIKSVHLKEQQVSLNRKKIHRKKSKKHVSLDSPSNKSASSYSSSSIENNSVGSLEDLASWWQSTYAAAQQPEVNQLIEQAILEKAVSPSNSTGKQRVSNLQTLHHQRSSSYRQPKSSLQGKSSSVILNTISSTFLNSSTSCGNEGDSEGGSIGHLAGSQTSSHTSRNSDSVGKANLETDDDVFSGIEDDERTLDSKLDKDFMAAKGGFKIHSLHDAGGGDVSIKDTSTCDDTHTTDLLNALDEENFRIAKPSLVPLKSPRVNKVEGKNVKTTALVPPEVTDTVGKSLNRVPPKPDDGRQEKKNKVESDEEMSRKTDDYEESNRSKGVSQASVNKMFEKLSCSFLEGFVDQFCQDPKKASTNFIEALCQNPEASTERYTGSGIVNEEEMVKNREMESAPSLSDASDFPEQKLEKASFDKQGGGNVEPVTNKIESEVHTRGNKLPESFPDENVAEKDCSSEAGAEDSSSMAVFPLPVTQSKASPKRITFLSIGKVTAACKVTPSTSAKSTASLVSTRSSRAGQKQLLDRFCWKLLHDGMEVLKLNSDKIWQTRYLTVSQEVTCLSNEVVDGARETESNNLPKALLWVKKLTASKDHSVNAIEKNGKGGILFSHVACVEELTGRHIPVSKKQIHGKFKDSVTVVLKSTDQGGSKIVYFRCGTRQEALVLCAGCNMITKMLHANKQPLLPLNSNKLPPSITSAPIEDPKSKAKVLESKNVEIEGDNDLWEV